MEVRPVLASLFTYSRCPKPGRGRARSKGGATRNAVLPL
jgi:hypothetical protein